MLGDFAHMKQLTPEVLREAVGLITELRSGRLDDVQLSAVKVRLDALLLDPHWMGYTIDRVPELPPAEVVRKAFEYSPFLMPGPSESHT
jgi:hypothetical protein